MLFHDFTIGKTEIDVFLHFTAAGLEKISQKTPILLQFGGVLDIIYLVYENVKGGVVI